MLKLMGAVLVVLAFTMLGFRIADNYRMRPRQLRLLIRSLTSLQAEIEYQATPLPEALVRVAAKTSPPFSKMFERVSHRLLEGKTSVDKAFVQAIKDLEQSSSLHSGDCEAVLLVAQSLATMDREHLHTQFQLSVESLGEAERLAREQGQKNGRLFQYLGVLTGVMLVILLY